MEKILFSKRIFNENGRDLIRSSGFTMIEMIVSLSIIFLLAGAFLANYHYGTQRGNLDMAAQKLASDINLVKSYALGLKEHTNSNGTTFPAGGWGIRFSASADGSYIFFADIIPDYYYTNGQYAAEKYSDAGLSQKNMAIARININCSVSHADQPYGYVVFIPPDPRIVLTASQNLNAPPSPTGPDDYCTELEIVLRATATNEEKTITINQYGLIDID